MAETVATCPRSLSCPVCGARPGQSCKRPSGHRAAELHAARLALAENGASVETAPLAGQLALDPAETDGALFDALSGEAVG